MKTSARRLASLFAAALLIASSTGCVTTASMYVQQGVSSSDAFSDAAITGPASDLEARIQVDIKKQWN